MAKSRAEVKSNALATLPPQARKVPHKMKLHKDLRIDNYFWMREREMPEVTEHLQSENKYVEAIMAPTQTLQEQLIREFRARIKEDDESAPLKRGSYEYFTRYTNGAEYPLIARRTVAGKKEEILLDISALAAKHKYYDGSHATVSPDHNLLVQVVDTVGRRFYDLHFKDLRKQKFLPQIIKNTAGQVEWLNDNRTVIYVKQDPVTLREYQIYRWTLPESGNKTPDPELIYEEKDEQFSLSIDKSLSDAEIYIISSSKMTSETQILDANDPAAKPQVFLKRVNKHEYTVYDGGDRYYILTNDKAKNFRLVETDKDKPEKRYWHEVVAHSPSTLLEQVLVLKNHLVLEQRSKGLAELLFAERTSSRGKLKFKKITFPDPAYVASLGAHAEFDTNKFRYHYESLTKPETIFDYEFTTGQTAVIKVESVPTYNPELYESQRYFATARDGTKVPISLVYKKSLFKKGENPLYVYGYGSYGYSTEAYFRSSVVSLLDRGFVFAVAHVRGGSEMGRHWYDDGKILKKKHTFTDFIDCTESLIKKGFGKKNHVYAMGGSAGGLLIGAVMNLRPDLYRGMIAAVPFVDVVTTMLDDSIPLTTAEYEEWGNPNVKKYYDYIRSYSPYDNIKKQNYPNLLVTTGFHDSQVQYWEPAKWVAKLRDYNTSQNLILFKTEMEAGHSGTTGRFQSLKETALDYAFFLKLENINK